MAEKDWKFTNTYKDEYGDVEYNFYSNQKNGDSLNIGKSNVKKGWWFVDVNYGNILEKWFKTKPQALSFAKQYMRTH